MVGTGASGHDVSTEPPGEQLFNLKGRFCVSLAIDLTMSKTRINPWLRWGDAGQFAADARRSIRVRCPSGYGRRRSATEREVS
jgi:hypothetical protein